MKKEIPTAEEILEFISESNLPAHKNEIAKSFHLRGDDRVELKAILKQLLDDKLIVKSGAKSYVAVEATVAESSVIEVVRIDKNGELIGYPVKGEKLGNTKIYVNTNDGQIKPGDRVLGKCRRDDATGHFEANEVRKIRHHSENDIICTYKINKDGERTLIPSDRKNKRVYFLDKKESENLNDGDLVEAKITPSPAYERREKVRIIRKIADKNDPHAISLISINSYEIPNEFSPEAMQQAKENSVPELGDREDLRDTPLITIDGADARDFDDAVYAKETKDGFDIIVAIADVSYYVRPNSVLDREAYERGNSTYFADRVVPM
jgi:ribonuclease R